MKNSKYFVWVLGKEVTAHCGIYHLPIQKVSVVAWLECLKTLCEAGDRNLIAHLYFCIPHTVKQAADVSPDDSNTSSEQVKPFLWTLLIRWRGRPILVRRIKWFCMLFQNQKISPTTPEENSQKSLISTRKQSGWLWLSTGAALLFVSPNPQSTAISPTR